MKKYFLFINIFLLFGSLISLAQEISLRDAFKDKFLIGVALNAGQVVSTDKNVRNLVDNQFSAVVAENCMKSMYLQPQEGHFDFKMADQLIEMAERNGQIVIGHCLVWHSQLPSWFLKDNDGKRVSKELLGERIQNHIKTVMSRYKGKVKGWDVVNEAVENDGQFRKSPFYEILGEDFLEIAFKAADEADPDAELYYNDYSMHLPAKRKKVVNMINDLKAKGCRIDAIGMQSHMDYGVPLDEYEKSIEAFAATGCKVMITELDVSALPTPYGQQGAAVESLQEYQEKLNPFVNGMPEDAEAIFTDYYCNLFEIYLKHAKDITRVNFWGLSDSESWKNNFPVRGRTDYPLAYDRQLKPKRFVAKIIQMALNGKW